MGREECALDMEAGHGVNGVAVTPPLTTFEAVLSSCTPSYSRSHLGPCQHQHLPRRVSGAYDLHIDRALRRHIGRETRTRFSLAELGGAPHGLRRQLVPCSSAP
jgi:hypothetical protein